MIGFYIKTRNRVERNSPKIHNSGVEDSFENHSASFLDIQKKGHKTRLPKDEPATQITASCSNATIYVYRCEFLWNWA